MSAAVRSEWPDLMVCAGFRVTGKASEGYLKPFRLSAEGPSVHDDVHNLHRHTVKIKVKNTIRHKFFYFFLLLRRTGLRGNHPENAGGGRIARPISTAGDPI